MSSRESIAWVPRAASAPGYEIGGKRRDACSRREGHRVFQRGGKASGELSIQFWVEEVSSWSLGKRNRSPGARAEGLRGRRDGGKHRDRAHKLPGHVIVPQLSENDG